MTTATADERAALAASEAAREAHLLALGRELADDRNPDISSVSSARPEGKPGNPSDLERVHNEARRIRKLREALAARPVVEAAKAAEAAARTDADTRRQALKDQIQALTHELAGIDSQVRTAASHAVDVAHKAGSALALLLPNERTRIAALQQAASAARAKALAARRAADDAPGLIERLTVKVAELAARLAQVGKGGDEASWRMGLSRREAETRAELERAKALSPSTLRKEAAAHEREAERLDRELAQAWADVEAAVVGK